MCLSLTLFSLMVQARDWSPIDRENDYRTDRSRGGGTCLPSGIIAQCFFCGLACFAD